MRKPTARDIRLLTLYLLTEEEYQRVFEHQGGKCAICRRPPVKYKLSVDHDHATGEVRGLVCRQCNKGLAYFRDDQQRLLRASEYIRVTPVSQALGYSPVGRVGRVTRKWKTRRERRERMAVVAERLVYLGYALPKRLRPSDN